MTEAQEMAQRMGYSLPSTDAERREANALMFDRFAKAAAKSDRKDATALSSHFAQRAESQRAA